MWVSSRYEVEFRPRVVAHCDVRERAGRRMPTPPGGACSTPAILPILAQRKNPRGNDMAETIEGFVGRSLDEAKISPLHVRAIALIAAGYFFDVIDLIVLGSLIPDMLQSNFATGPQAALVGTFTVLGMFIGAAGQGEFSDRWGRKTVYQFNLLIFGIFTILGALAPSVTWLMAARF